ncbi:hypothetical protein HanPSC8_Chr05g0207311 [Helianthus annuus]|nr:hypothetical protein HanPSC8_Chr05g0207311 [Helianthus annuus]
MNKHASLFPSFSRHLSILGLISSKHQTRVSQVQGSSFSLILLPCLFMVHE